MPINATPLLTARTDAPKYLWAFSAADSWTLNWHQKLIARRRAMGYDISGFCVTPDSMHRRWLHFPDLDQKWREGDGALLQMYEDLSRALEGRDVLILYNGANLHPEFVKSLSVLKVYTAGDDPESTEVLTKPVAPYFDIHLINNIAAVDMYKSWGLKDVHFWPLGSLTSVEDVQDITEEKILAASERSVPIAFFGEYQKMRAGRLDTALMKYPEAVCAGRGWPRGLVPWDEMWSTYRKTQVGWNFHNSTGPINFRTYELPAFGVMQICDNKSHLNEIFTLDKEVIGFNDLDECMDLTRYYLAHPNEQRQIALAGWHRWKRDYHPDKVWEKLNSIVEPRWRERLHEKANSTSIIRELKLQRRKGLPLRVLKVIRMLIPTLVFFSKRVIRFLRNGGRRAAK